MGKTIYQPSGKAKEYSRWACNLHVGCSNDCTYCFNKQGVLSTIAGTSTRLKKGLTEYKTYMQFEKELQRYTNKIKKNGYLFFSFTTDPCLPENLDLTMRCVTRAVDMEVPCMVLTKCAGWVLEEKGAWIPALEIFKDRVAIGFTLTGMDRLEPGASPNADRIRAMRALHERGFRTFASIEPVIDFDKSLEMIRLSAPWCDHYKVGLLSGNRHAYDKYQMPFDLETFVFDVNEFLTEQKKPVYWKNSVKTAIGHPIEDPCCVDETFNMFKQ